MLSYTSRVSEPELDQYSTEAVAEQLLNKENSKLNMSILFPYCLLSLRRPLRVYRQALQLALGGERKDLEVCTSTYRSW